MAYSAPLSPSSLRCRHNYEPGEYIAVVNGGAIRAGLDKGPVYTENVQAILPFKDEARYVFANGTVIKQMLEHSVRNNGPSFLSVHGLQFWWDPKAKPGSRVQRAMVRSNLG
jgi:2',3'-cyclic-nucleotide 2'-phosphodiesterase (5'-nucleotidase family)